MGAPEPEEIFERTRREGERRLTRPFLELASTAAAAGLDVVFGIIALATTTALLTRHGVGAAHLAGAILSEEQLPRFAPLLAEAVGVTVA
jgi:formate/nitrite transporter FocA (FNT family)